MVPSLIVVEQEYRIGILLYGGELFLCYFSLYKLQKTFDKTTLIRAGAVAFLVPCRPLKTLLFEPRVFLVLLGGLVRNFQLRPLNRNIRIIPGDAALSRRIINIRTLINKLRGI